MDKAQIASRFAQAQSSYDQHAIAQKYVAETLCQLMQAHLPYHDFQQVLEIGCGSGLFSQLFMQNFQYEHIYLNDLYAEVQQFFQKNEHISWCIGDAEKIVLPSSLDLVMSCSALQWMQDQTAFIQRIAQHLKAKKYLCFASYAENNLLQIKRLTGQGLVYLSLFEQCQMLTEQGFEILHASEVQLNVAFQHPKAVLAHMKATGVQATGQGFRWTKTSLQQFYQDYQAFQDRETALYPLTYHPTYIIAQKRI